MVTRRDSGPGIKIGARAHRAEPARHSFGVEATIEIGADGEKLNDEESQRRRLSDEAPSAPRLAARLELNDDQRRKRKRALTADRGRRALGSRRVDRLSEILKNASDYLLSGGYDSDKENSAGAQRREPTRRPPGAELTPMTDDDVIMAGSAETAAMSRLLDHWVDCLTEAGQLPPGEGRDEAIKALGAQRQRAEAYAAAAARAAPRGTGFLVPIVKGSSVPEGLEATAAAAMTLDDAIKLSSCSMAQVACEADGFLRLAPFPVTNVPTVAQPMPEVPDAPLGVAPPGWRPSALTDVYTPDGVRQIIGWFERMRRYEENGIAKAGSGLRRPEDLVLGDDYVQTAARGRAWYLLDHVRSGDKTTKTIISSMNKSRSALQAVVLQHQADFAMRTSVMTRVRRVKSKDNTLSDPVPRLTRATFKDEARKLGATKFVRLPISIETINLIDSLSARLKKLEDDGEPTSGTASCVEEVYAREQRYMETKGDPPEPAAPDDGNGFKVKASPRWGFVSGFCGAGSMSFAATGLRGVLIAGFDSDEAVQKLWTERTGIRCCWGSFDSVLTAACDGDLDWLRSSTLVYISGSPCPNFSRAGRGRGLFGATGSLWLNDCHLGIRLRPQIIIREMVTGIFDHDSGAPFWAAIDLYRDAGYTVSWSVRMARRHGDPTLRRRGFLAAVRPDCMKEGVTADDFFSLEWTSSDEVSVAVRLDQDPEEELVVPTSDERPLPERDASGYEGPNVVGTI